MTVFCFIAVFLPAASFAAVGERNGKLAFTRATGTGSSINTVDPDGGNLADLVSSSTSSKGSPAWSPDGSRLAFSQGLEIVRIDQDGSNQTTLTVPSYASFPAWMPDGKNILYSSGSSVDQLSLTSADASTPGAGTRFLSSDKRQVTVSPDGKQIAFIRVSDSKLYVADLTADFQVLNERNLAAADESGAYKVEKPTFSPDGQKLAFVRCASGRNRDFCELEKINTIGDKASLTTLSNLSRVQDPAWSPDGAKIAFAWTPNSAKPNDIDIYTVNSDGTGLTQITSGSANDSWPAWQPLAASVVPPISTSPTPEPPPAVGPPVLPSPNATTISLDQRFTKLLRVRGRIILRLKGKITPASDLKEIALKVTSVGQKAVIEQQGKIVVQKGEFVLKNYRLERAFQFARRVKITVTYDGQKSQGRFASSEVSKILSAPAPTRKKSRK